MLLPIFLIGLGGLLSALAGLGLSVVALVLRSSNPSEATNWFRRGNVLLLVSSGLSVFHIVNAFTVQNEKSVYQVVVQYSVLAIPVAVALFAVAAGPMRQQRASTAFWWFAGSAASWATVGWAHIVMFWSLIELAVFLR
ncbi:MAG: hypothetical protein HC933_10530 [Pleurocapsa sp. SU_196_0]|nr:hypothetical protein [Pleurocapsa sp. SU_196_0]